jgi:long-subunit fatty acid transport protein
MIMKKIVLTSAAALLAVGMAANASNVYVLGGMGYNKAMPAKNSSFNKSQDKSYTVGLGYNINKNFAVQGEYTNEPASLKPFDGGPTPKATAHSIAVEAKATMPLSKVVSAYALGGAAYNTYKIDGKGTADTYTPVAGLGIGYKVSKQVSLDLASQYEFGKDKKDVPAYWNTAVEAQFNF